MSLKTSKESLTTHERLQLIGLLTLGRDWQRKRDEVLDAMAALTGELDWEGKPDTAGLCYDAICGDIDADEILRRLNITVVAPPAPPAVVPA